MTKSKGKPFAIALRAKMSDIYCYRNSWKSNYCRKDKERKEAKKSYKKNVAKEKNDNLTRNNREKSIR